MPTTLSLSKSKFVAGCQCLRRLYYQFYPPEGFVIDESANAAIFSSGHDVGELAREAFPGGVLVDEDFKEHAKAVAHTLELMADPKVPAIFEAAFTAEGIKIRADVLRRRPRGWDLIEVKQTTSVKDYHLNDVAIQKYVVEHSGVKVCLACLMHLNIEYVYDGKKYDLSRLFTIEDVGSQIKKLMPEIPKLLAQQWAALRAKTPPAVKPNGQCEKPYTCEFYDFCNLALPIDHVRHLPRLTAAQLEYFERMGIESILAIPDDHKLSDAQTRARASHLHKKMIVESGIHDEIAMLKYPLFFMDFETIMQPIPVHAGTHPYQQILFQWSVHVLDKPKARLKHYDFLAEDESDPREPFITQLLDVLETGDGQIVVYNQAFEEKRLRELADLFPKYRKRIEKVCARLWDLLPLIRQHVYHPEFLGSFSIKSVLPALVPGMSYSEMDVADGTQAGQTFLQMLSPGITNKERQNFRRALLEYCGQDTRAMHEILRQF